MSTEVESRRVEQTPLASLRPPRQRQLGEQVGEHVVDLDAVRTRLQLQRRVRAVHRRPRVTQSEGCVAVHAHLDRVRALQQELVASVCWNGDKTRD